LPEAQWPLRGPDHTRCLRNDDNHVNCHDERDDSDDNLVGHLHCRQPYGDRKDLKHLDHILRNHIDRH
jgi:hypothetical protein